MSLTAAFALLVLSNVVACPPHALVRAHPAELGVSHVQLMGQMLNADTGVNDTVVLHAFVKMIRGENDTVKMYGIAWIEGLHVGTDSMGWVRYAPSDQIQYVKHIPILRIQPVGLDRRPVGSPVLVRVTYGSTDDWRRMGFRIDANFSSRQSAFQLQPDGWQRSFLLHITHTVRQKLILPWNRVHQGTGHVQKPLVAVVTLHSTPGPTSAHSIFYAQQLLRHVEYHLGQLHMQRMLVYVPPVLFHDFAFHDFFARHVPPQLVPFLTFVFWDEFFAWQPEPLFDQYLKYYHATVALWGYMPAFLAFFDVDEYIAFSKPHQTLHEALLGCSDLQVSGVVLQNAFLVCEHCIEAYKQGNAGYDREQWAGFARNFQSPALLQSNLSLPQTDCRWYHEDPLSIYTRRWNNKWFIDKGWGSDESKYTWQTYTTFQGKMLMQAGHAVAFIHHRAEMLPGANITNLDPRNCPYIAHFAHINGFRPLREGAGLEYFSGDKASWWLLPQQTA